MRMLLAAFLSIFCAPSTWAEDTYRSSLHHPAAPLFAKKVAKKKKRQAPEDDFGPSEIAASEDNDNGVGIHREQIGVDTPYKAEAGGAGDISFLQQKTGSASAQPVTNIDINIRILFIAGHAALGAELGLLYNATQFETPADAAAGSAATTVKSTTTGVSLIPMFKWNFTDINHSLTVPFAYGGAGYAVNQVKTGEAPATKATGPIVKAGAGLNLFLTGFAAINPAIEYRISTLKSDTVDATTESGVHLLGGFTLFL